MAKSTTSSQLAQLMKQLLAERQEHVDAIDAIDQTFEKLGISPRRTRRRPGRPKGAKTRKATKRSHKRGKRGTYRKTADELILGLFTGGKKLSTAQIVAKWHQAGRGGKADNTLTKLVSQKKLKREKIKGGRGSEYSLA